MKVKRLLTIGVLAICFVMPSVTTFAATQNIKGGAETQANPNYWTGKIKSNNVNIRNDKGVSLGQVNKGDTFRIDMALDGRYFNNIFYRKVTMTSGNNRGVTGWVAADYISLNW